MRVPMVSRSSCGAETIEKVRRRSPVSPGKPSGRTRSIDWPGVKSKPSGFLEMEGARGFGDLLAA